LRVEISFKSLYQHLIQRWYLLVGVGLVGAVAASLIVFVAPKKYRAQAVVMVDQQVELAVPPSSPVDDVLYVSRETVRLEELSYSDSLWEAVYALVDTPEFEAEIAATGDLRESVRAPHYQDGAWYFTAEHTDPAFAAALANAWAESFTATLQGWVETAQEEHSLQAQIDELAILQAANIDECAQLHWAADRVAEIRRTTLSQPDITQDEINQTTFDIWQMAQSASLSFIISPSSDSIDDAVTYSAYVFSALEENAMACSLGMDLRRVRIENLTEELAAVVESSRGVSPYLRVHFSRAADEPVRPTIEIGNAAFTGFIVAVALWLMAGVTGYLDRFSRGDRGQI
jgi:capsular polysaccharide biosynthesis protein